MLLNTYQVPQVAYRLPKINLSDCFWKTRCADKRPFRFSYKLRPKWGGVRNFWSQNPFKGHLEAGKKLSDAPKTILSPSPFDDSKLSQILATQFHDLADDGFQRKNIDFGVRWQFFFPLRNDGWELCEGPGVPRPLTFSLACTRSGNRLAWNQG